MISIPATATQAGHQVWHANMFFVSFIYRRIRNIYHDLMVAVFARCVVDRSLRLYY
jgi:hypothetical protein